MEPVADPFVTIVAAGLIGFLAGAALIFLMPQRQPAMKYVIVGSAILIMIADAMGYKLVRFGSAIDPSDPARLVSLVELLGPRIAFLGFMGGIISFGLSRRVQNVTGIMVVSAMIMGSSGGFGGGLI